MYNLPEYRDNCLKTSGNLWQYYRDEPSPNATNGAIVDFTGANHNSKLFKYKQKLTGATDDNGIKMLKK